LHDYILLSMSFILDFRGLYFCAAYLPANNLRRIYTTYLQGYWKGSENGRVVTIAIYLVISIIINSFWLLC